MQCTSCSIACPQTLVVSKWVWLARLGSLMHAGQQCPCRQRGLALLVHSFYFLFMYSTARRCIVIITLLLHCALIYIIERHHQSSRWERQVFFPLSFFFLLSLTCVSLLLVVKNIFNLVMNSNYLPRGTKVGLSCVNLSANNQCVFLLQDHNLYSLGDMSSSYMGPLGTIVEVILIMYPALQNLQRETILKIQFLKQCRMMR